MFLPLLSVGQIDPSFKIENLGTKVVFQGKMGGKVFYTMNNFGIVHFTSFMIDVWKYIFRAITFIHAAFSKCF